MSSAHRSLSEAVAAAGRAYFAMRRAQDDAQRGAMRDALLAQLDALLDDVRFLRALCAAAARSGAADADADADATQHAISAAVAALSSAAQQQQEETEQEALDALEALAQEALQRLPEAAVLEQQAAELAREVEDVRRRRTEHEAAASARAEALGELLQRAQAFAAASTCDDV